MENEANKTSTSENNATKTTENKTPETNIDKDARIAELEKALEKQKQATSNASKDASEFKNR